MTIGSSIINPAPAQAALKPSKNQSPAQQRESLKKACQGFESYFVDQMMKEMRKTIPKTDVFGDDSSQEEMFRDMSDQALADKVSKSGSFGIADMMYRQLSKNIPDDSQDTAENPAISGVGDGG
jgi:flagellar protein FlgJ